MERLVNLERRKKKVPQSERHLVRLKGEKKNLKNPCGVGWEESVQGNRNPRKNYTTQGRNLTGRGGGRLRTKAQKRKSITRERGVVWGGHSGDIKLAEGRGWLKKKKRKKKLGLPPKEKDPIRKW